MGRLLAHSKNYSLWNQHSDINRCSIITHTSVNTHTCTCRVSCLNTGVHVSKCHAWTPMAPKRCNNSLSPPPQVDTHPTNCITISPSEPLSHWKWEHPNVTQDLQNPTKVLHVHFFWNQHVKVHCFSPHHTCNGHVPTHLWRISQVWINVAPSVCYTLLFFLHNAQI